MDIARVHPYEATGRFRRDRTVELLGRLHSTGSWPHSHPARARNIRRSVLHDRLAAAGARFGESSGWENVSWFGPSDVEFPHEATYRRPGWWAHHEAEHRATREAVALYDMSSMSNFYVEGPDAERVLNGLGGNDVAVEPGRCVYTQWMSPAGKVLADLTVTRLAEHRYLVVVAEAFHRRVENMLRRAIGDDRVAVFDATSGITLMSVQGPRSRELLCRVTGADLTNEAFPYFTAQEIDLGYAVGWALRMSFVGELGWELAVPAEFATSVYETLVEEGADLGLVHAGMVTLESTRTEAGRRDYGLDMENTDSPIEAGLSFALAWDKAGGFVGRDALLAERAAGPPTRRLAQFLLSHAEPLLFGEEPIFLGGERVGYLRSGNYGHTLGGAMGMGYVEHPDGVTRDMIIGGEFEIQVAGQMVPASATLRPMYDPEGRRVRM